MKQPLIVCWILLCLLGSLSMGIAQEEEPDINAFVFVEKEPNPLNINEVRKSIGYPEEAIEANAQGAVIARILVDKEGKYVRHKITKEIHPALAGAVEGKLNELTFEPAIQNGNPVMFWVNIPFPFKLVDEQEEALKKNIEELTERLNAEPENFELWHKRGIQRSQLGEYDDAVVDFTESLNINPRKNKKKKKKNTYEYLFYAHYGRAAVYAKQEKFKEAISDYSQSLQIAQEMAIPDSGVEASLKDVYLERGYIYALDQQYEPAKKDFNWVLANHAEDKCVVYPLLADIGLNENNFSELVVYYTGLIECNPEDENLFYSRGYYRLQSEDYEGAVLDLGVTAEKTQTDLLKIAAHNHTALAYLRMKKYPEALKEIDAAMLMNALNPLSYYVKGLVGLEQDQQEDACKSLKRAINFGLEGKEGEHAAQLLKETCGIEE